MIDYGQFCTVARGAEVLCDRWTPLVLRELLCGSTHFNEIRRGVPRMSPSLLAKRLRTLEEFGVVRRTERGRATSYELTAAGEELRPVVLALGHWGARWIGSRLSPNHLDAGFLMWDIRRFARVAEFPRDRRVVVHFRLPDAADREREWWLVVEDGVADLCRDDPGHDLDVVVHSSLRALTEVWTGDRTPEQVLLTREVRLDGAPGDVRSVWAWLGTSGFAPTRAAALRAAAPT
ncbi:helix-turn-helix domain-containing protein [uncultured Phycicoccus sp.]|uniref:winged helix-turn-helix transcriptional regulator n=1 Tax=uncultured Phycicoccus sp. TaxID=661422 RepID=UPI0026334FCA|nr:helix-turn-helix domain-containing protein [uncultured Phycicoccus sp.]